ncbi:MAG: GspH/FimT family pseudopilin [Gammaproteobacteria bacterium]|nr:GspH/FimT family pseudopilin [Gammaproteobacteria bacterium]
MIRRIIASRDTEREAASRPRARLQSGFSLLELMVALAVGGLLLSLGVPGYMTVTKNARIVASANGFLADMHYMRDLAITSNERVVMCPTSSGSGCDAADWAEGRMVFVDRNADGSPDPGEPIERVSEPARSLSVQAFAFGGSITYRPNGRVTTGTGTGAFLMCDDRGSDHARAVMVDPSGRPRVSHLARVGSTAPCPS